MQTRTKAWERILISLFVVGSFDICEVTLFYAFRGVPPTRILQSVASGWFGPASFSGGMKTTLIGLATHYLIATIVVTVYYFASRKISILRTRPVIMGALYGLGVWCVMNFIVVPLSAAATPKIVPTLPVFNNLFAHVVCIGMATGIMTTRQRD